MKAVIGIGTNIGDRANNIKESIAALRSVPGVSVLRVSDIYETAPWGYEEQNSFYNCIVETQTELTADMLLGVCLGIESGMGRVRLFKNGPRVIDLDLLICENIKSDSEHLMLPHPRIGERDFVLVPLKDLYDDMQVLGFSFEKEYKAIAENSSAVCVLSGSAVLTE